MYGHIKGAYDSCSRVVVCCRMNFLEREREREVKKLE